LSPQIKITNNNWTIFNLFIFVLFSITLGVQLNLLAFSFCCGCVFLLMFVCVFVCDIFRQSSMLCLSRLLFCFELNRTVLFFLWHLCRILCVSFDSRQIYFNAYSSLFLSKLTELVNWSWIFVIGNTYMNTRMYTVHSHEHSHFYMNMLYTRTRTHWTNLCETETKTQTTTLNTET
jgi:hypothetical protein